jgi:signal transduction histidine kinase
MEYIYQQKPRPMDVTGVPVTISVVDSNGNYREIGAATTDTDGYYSYAWQPDIEGKYVVYASFTGSKAYWPSHAVTSFVVDPAAATPAPTQQAQTSMADTYILPGIAAIIVVLVIGFVATILVLRRRP